MGLSGDHWSMADPDHHHWPCSLHHAWVGQDSALAGVVVALPVLLLPTAPGGAQCLPYKVTCTSVRACDIIWDGRLSPQVEKNPKQKGDFPFLLNTELHRHTRKLNHQPCSWAISHHDNFAVKLRVVFVIGIPEDTPYCLHQPL